MKKLVSLILVVATIGGIIGGLYKFGIFDKVFKEETEREYLHHCVYAYDTEYDDEDVVNLTILGEIERVYRDSENVKNIDYTEKFKYDCCEGHPDCIQEFTFEYNGDYYMFHICDITYMDKMGS